MADSGTESTGLVQRCVVVQKDQLGFGFTVCGERVKLVQNVRAGGAADKAGVHEGDRIIKVNGSLVSCMTHQEVVKLIKSGTYAALTLQGPAPSPLNPLPRDSSPNQSTHPPPTPVPPQSGHASSPCITGPRPLQDSEVQKQASKILRKMLEQEEAELQTLQEELALSPSPILEQRIQSAKRRALQVKGKIQQDLDGARFLQSGANNMKAEEGGPLTESTEGDSEAQKPLIIGPEEDDDDEDACPMNEMDSLCQDIEMLKSRPAHMTVFMRYIFSQHLDPAPLLFFLSVEAYLGSVPKDARLLAPQICTHFLDSDAPLKIQIREDDMSDIESRLQAQEDIRGPLSELQQQVLPDIQEQIQDYRSKRLLGLGALFGEGDLQHLDGDPGKERQVVDQQVTALWEILVKHEQERSSALAWAVVLYLRHAGIRLREARPWLPFLPRAKKLSGTKRDAEDRKRIPILKYISNKPRGNQPTSFVPLSPTPVPGSVRNMIQQFESQQPDPAGGEEAGPESPGERLSSSLGEQSGAESDSLKAQGEGRRRGAGGEAGPRSHSDVDMEDCGAELLLHHSISSSASSHSARSVESVGVGALDEDGGELQVWQEMVDPQTVAALGPREVDRQAVIYELYTTEVSHLRTLRLLEQLFLQSLRAVLSAEQLACIFPNLSQVYSLHASLCDSMKKLRESPVVQGIGDIMLERFEGVSGAEFQEQVSLLCSRQSQALEIIKDKQRRDPQFANIIQECEASPHCRRLQLKDLLVSEMQRLTKYPLLLDNILKHTDRLSPDLLPLQKAQTCCRRILQAVNEVVRETEHEQRLVQYQRRLDLTPLERQANPVAAQFKNLDLTTKRMIHEGPLTWRVSKEKVIEVQALLLSDLLVLLQRGPEERLVLRCPSRLGAGASGELKTSCCPLVRLQSLLVRAVATDSKALYLISTSEEQIYELVARTSSEKNTWKDFLEKSISVASASAPILEPASASALKSGIYQSEHSFSEGSICIETDAAKDRVSMVTTPADQSQASLVGKRQEFNVGRVADAALQDVETLRQLIVRDLEDDVRDLEDDGWTHDCNGATNERSLFTHGPDEPESGALVREGNTFYLMLSQEQEVGETQTEQEVGKTQSEEASSSHPSLGEHQDTPPHPADQSQDEQERQAVTQSQSELVAHTQNQSELVTHSPVISSVGEIFSTIEQLMDKLQQLRDIEVAHYQLLLTLTDQPVNQMSGDSFQTTPTDARAIEHCGNDASPTLQEIQSTGF
ncbi:rho guanine nucleotide exchange factor 11 isoform X2 [Conger conger]|uniref:rho guanine nucleotide exchange factor 11 isoform X2 n=1 Tax=Conger conger TaxID=82655 RepID=UPI002A5A1007|nr:rho guanine nucleotide exchange factor 11 isoform X2 [Conger conger]